MMKYLSALTIAVSLGLSMFSFRALGAVEKATAGPATTQAALPACCGDACKKMGGVCCKADDKGKVTCSMGGSCCVKADTTPKAAAKGMECKGCMGMGE